ncbi:MAG: Gldg family protein [Victivallales bacterium]|nr:Gldg family protein [Victivallales bacterium]
MRNFLSIYRRELWLSFATPLAATLLVIYLLLSGILTLTLGGFIETNLANLSGFFVWQPWLFLILGAALGMGQWSNEYRDGTAELLLTMPVSIETLVLAKFLSGLSILFLGLLLTTPFALVCEWLGNPDWGPILTGYFGCLCCASLFLALGQAASVCSRNPFASGLCAFVLGLALLLAGFRPFNLMMIKWGCPSYIIEVVASLSLIRHFESFPQGLIALRAVYLFFAWTVFFLSFAILWLRRRHLSCSRHRTLAALVLWLVLIILFPVFEQLPARVDCTAEKHHTLDTGSRAILDELATPVVIDFYYSRDFPELPAPLRNHASRVEELLNELTRASHGRITLKCHNPKEDAEQLATQDRGLQPHIGSLGDLWFLGAVFTPEDATLPTQVIADFPESEADLLEYQLMRAIDATQRATKRRLGLYSTLPVLEHVNPQTKNLLPTWWCIEQLGSQFEIVPVDQLDSASLRPDLDLLMLVHPKEITPEQEDAIAGYLRQGGGLIALLDPLSRADVQQQGRFAVPQPSTLPNLLQAWGVTFHHTRVVADRTLATPMTNSIRGMENLPTLLTLRSEQLNQECPLTAHLSSLSMFCAGAFDFTPQEGIQITPLATTTKDSRLLAIYEAQRNGSDILTDFQPDGQTYHVALLVEGKETKALLVGDVEFLHNSLCIDKTTDTQGNAQEHLISDNGTLLTNAAEYLCSDARLLRVRSRGRQARTFQRIEALARQTERRIQELDAEAYRQNEPLRQQLRQIAVQGDLDSPEIRRQLDEVEAIEAQREAELRLHQRQELHLLRLELDRIERQITLLCVVLAPALLAVFALAMAWRRRA